MPGADAHRTEHAVETRSGTRGGIFRCHRVVPLVRRPCPHNLCQARRAGRQDFCYTGEFTEPGIKGAHGFLTAFIVEEAAYLVRVPAELRSVAGARIDYRAASD
jgi:hypothetical protein